MCHKLLTVALAAGVTLACNDAVRTPISPGSLGDEGKTVKSSAPARSVIRVPGDFTTIQAAVNAASPGDTIRVASGIYCESVVITKSDVRLQSPAGSNRAVVTGDCPAINRLGAGIHVMNASGVEVMGFVVEYFEFGIQLMSTTGSRIHLNESRFNRTVPRTGVPPLSRGNGILLLSSNHNVVTQNDLHENGRNGITLNGSSDNTIRGNRLKDNNWEQGGCNLMLTAASNNNAIVENEVLGTFGVGIMIGPGIATGNRVAQNRVHGFAGPGIIAMASAALNLIEQNDAKGNGLSAVPFDLLDQSQPADNTWTHNLGTCGPGVC